jgi:hypothetical protein
MSIHLRGGPSRSAERGEIIADIHTISSSQDLANRGVDAWAFAKERSTSIPHPSTALSSLNAWHLTRPSQKRILDGEVRERKWFSRAEESERFGDASDCFCRPISQVALPGA